MADCNSAELINDIYEIASDISRIRSNPIRMTDGTMVNASGLRMLEVVERNPDVNMSSISSELGVTKGATSQMAIKLAEAGLIEKKSVVGRDVHLGLTKKGKRVFTKMLKARKEIAESVKEATADYIAEDFEKISAFLKIVSDKVGKTADGISD